MLLLALDTATAGTSVAIVGEHGGAAVREQFDVLDARRHAESLPVLVGAALDLVGDASIDMVACGVGPGPFTGLRVGIATALAFGTARDIPVVGACTHDVIARTAQNEVPGPVTVLTRARRAELAWASYDAQGRRTQGPLIGREPFRVAGRCVGDAGPVEAVVHPRAVDLADLVLERLASGEPLPGDMDLPEAAATDSGSPAADMLGERVRAGLVLLPPRPIYLRRPDAVARDDA